LKRTSTAHLPHVNSHVCRPVSSKPHSAYVASEGLQDVSQQPRLHRAKCLSTQQQDDLTLNILVLVPRLTLSMHLTGAVARVGFWFWFGLWGPGPSVEVEGTTNRLNHIGKVVLYQNSRAQFTIHNNTPSQPHTLDRHPHPHTHHGGRSTQELRRCEHTRAFPRQPRPPYESHHDIDPPLEWVHPVDGDLCSRE